MPEVWSPDVSQEIQRAYDLTLPVVASGASYLSPVFNVGPGADAAISRSQSFALHVNVAAGVGVSGSAAIVLPSTDNRVAVIRSINVDAPTAGNQIMVTIQIPLGTLIETNFAPTLALMPTNLRNFSVALGPVLGFGSNANNPAISGVIDSIRVPANQSVPWHRRYAVIVPNTALVVMMNAANITYNVDFELDLYQPQSK